MRPVSVFLSVVGEKCGLAADDGHHRPHPALLKQRIGVNIVVVVAVIKGYHDGLLRQRRAVLHIGQQIADGNGCVSSRPQSVQIRRQYGRRNDVFSLPRRVFQDAVVHEDRHTHAVLRAKYRLNAIRTMQQTNREA